MGKVVALGAALQQHAPQRQARPGPAPALPALVPRPVYSADLVPAGLPTSVSTAAHLLCTPDARPVGGWVLTDLMRALFEPVKMVPFLLGHRQTLLEGADLFAMAMAVAEMLQAQFPALTVSEVALAFRRGCSGEWKKPDELLLASLPVMRSWLKSYTEGSRAQALAALQQAEHRQLQRLSLPAADPAADYPARVAALVAAARAAGRQPRTVAAGQRPGPGAYRLPPTHELDPGGLLLDWLRKIGALSAWWGNPGRVLLREGLRIMQELPRTAAHRSFAQHVRAGAVPGSHPLAGHYRVNCRQRQLRGWLLYHAARGTDLLTWLQQLAAAANQPTPDETRQGTDAPGAVG